MAKSETALKLSASLSEKPKYQRFVVWIVGDTPLITHAWSEKARREMLQKQLKAAKVGREMRDPQADFVNSLYEMGEGQFGFPATGIKLCILAGAHKDKGIARSVAMGALWIDAQMVRTRPALAGAICDMPLVRVFGSPPEMREDMVRVGKGLNKTASLAYRGQFTVWAVKVTGRFHPEMLSQAQLAAMINDAGLACGIGEWRNERKGMFGAFHLASVEEERAWELYITGKGSLPVPDSYKAAAE
jgi:hypothetical protein